MSAPELRTLTSADEVAALEGEWDSLVEAAPRPSPFLLNAWIAEWWRHYGDDATLQVHAAFSDGKLVGALPLFTRRERGLRITSFVGGGASALGDVIVAPGANETEIARALVDRAKAAPHDLFDLFGLPAGSRLGAAAGDGLRLIERVEAPVLDLSAGWEAVYAAKTSSKKRNLHKRRRRQLSEQGDLTVEVARTLDELEPALEAAFTLHEKRWAGRPDGSGFATATGRRFNRAVIRQLAPQERARIVTLKLDGSAIAFHYYFALCGCMYVYRLAFDPAVARFSPGLVNTLDAVSAAAEEGLRKVEYLGGDERYKLELSDELQPLHQGLGLAATPQGHAVVLARLASIRARRRLKRSPTLKRLYFDGLAPARRAVARFRPREATSE